MIREQKHMELLNNFAPQKVPGQQWPKVTEERLCFAVTVRSGRRPSSPRRRSSRSRRWRGRLRHRAAVGLWLEIEKKKML